MSPSTALGVGTVFEAGRYSTTGERKNFSVVYSLIFLVYSSSIGWFGPRPGRAIAKSASVVLAPPRVAGAWPFAWTGMSSGIAATINATRMAMVRRVAD